MRLFGAGLPLLPFGKEAKRAVQLLTFSQSVWYGVLFTGCGLFIVMTLFGCFDWTSRNTPVVVFSPRILLYAIALPAYGLLRGFTLADENKKRRNSAELSKQGLKGISNWDENGFAREKVPEPHGSGCFPETLKL